MMKKNLLLLSFLITLFTTANAQIVLVNPNNAIRGQTLMTTITMAAGIMTNSTPPDMSNDVYLQLGATIIYGTVINWQTVYDPWTQTWGSVDSGDIQFTIPANTPTGYYDVYINIYPGPTPVLYSLSTGFFIRDPAGTIEGSVYFDVNQNGARDVNDPGLPNARIHVAPSNDIAFTNSAGEFMYYGDTGTHTSTYLPRSGFTQTSAPLSYTATLPPSVTGQEFGTFLTGYLYGHNTVLHRIRNRCNTLSDVSVEISNVGLADVQDRVYLITSSNSVLSSSGTPPDMISGDTLMWITPTINPGGLYDLGDGLIFSIPAALQIVSITVIDSVFDLSGNFINVYSKYFNYEVRCSYDPNDKHVSPEGLLSQHYTPINSELTYDINFQNTGNDTAYDVFVLDTLNLNLDLSTFEVLASSHTMNTQMTTAGALRFNFFNIMLPDSGTDEPGSHGWITYKISPNTGLPDPTIITNTSHIIFDQNFPVITNTTMNTMTALQYPQANFTTADVSICETNCILFNNQSASGTSYAWSFNGGIPSSSTSATPPAVCYSTSGAYGVTLISTNALGSDTLTQSAYINVATSPGIFAVTQSGDSLIAPQGYATYEWYYNNVLFVGDTMYYHIATNNGDYGVVVSNTNGCQSGVNIPNVIIGVNELHESKEAAVYPNPSSGIFELSYKSMTIQNVTLTIIDNVGKVVQTKNLIMSSGLNILQLNAGDLASGIYTIRLAGKLNVVSKILMINK